MVVSEWWAESAVNQELEDRGMAIGESLLASWAEQGMAGLRRNELDVFKKEESSLCKSNLAFL
jgi:hypothetical protein